MSEKCNCACGTAPKLIFACSGGSDVGELTDRAARKMATDGIGKMYCLAGVGGRISGIMASTEAVASEASANLLVLDGCPLNCASKTMEEAGFKNFSRLCLADFGLTKGKTPASDENVEKIVNQGKTKLST